jgi:hypothetical protein
MLCNLIIIIILSVIMFCLKASHLYGLLVGESIGQFRLYEHMMQTLDLELSNKHIRCPACPKVTIHE